MIHTDSNYSQIKNVLLSGVKHSDKQYINFIKNTIFKQSSQLFKLLVLKMIYTPDIKANDLTETQITVIKKSYIPSKSIKVYSKILENMRNKDEYSAEEHNCVLRIMSALYFCSTSFEYYEQTKDLPF